MMTATTPPTGALLADWSLHGSQIKPDALRALMTKHGFDPSVVPDIDQTRAIKRVAGSWRVTKDGYASQIVKSASTADEVVISVRHAEEGVRQANARHVCELAWDAVNNQWMPWACAPEHRAAVTKLIAKCDQERMHLDCDFIRPVLIQAPLKGMGSVSFIRRSGGAQVIAAEHADEVGRICDLICDIGGDGCYMGAARVNLDDQRTASTVHRSVKQGLAEQVNEIRKDLAKWRERGTRLQTGAIGSRLVQFRELKETAAMYSRALQIAVDDLNADIDAATEDARNLLDIAMGKAPAPDADADAQQQAPDAPAPESAPEAAAG
jgi:hypothetical protein